MLFDLRARGRRTTIKIVYAGLAVLMGGGLVFFGIGGDVSGGLFDAFSERNQGGSAGFQDQIKKAKKQTQSNPRNPAGWAALARLEYQEAGQGENFDDATGQFTDKGKEQLRKVEAAWDRYIALDPPKPDAALAALMVQAFGPSGLLKVDKAVVAADIVAEKTPSANAFYQLAIFAYTAGQNRKADLAAARTVELTPKASRKAVQDQLKQAKEQGGLAAAQAQQQQQQQAPDSSNPFGGAGGGPTP